MTSLFRAIPASLLLVLPAMAEDDAFPLVTNRAQGWVDQGYYQGCSVWIAKGHETLYRKSFGSHTEDTEVFIASSGKWLASAALLAVVDEGKLSLDDTVEKWLPEFKNDPKGKATLRQLFSHTSGFPPYQPDDKPRDNYQTCAESVAHLLPLPPHFKPGEQFDYGGLAMQTAGRMAELATGKDWETIFQEKIARPLGMTKTRFTPVDPGHTPMLAGAAVSTLHDYSRFLTLIAGNGVFEGRRIVSETSMKEMVADQIGTARVKREEFVERVRGNTHHGIYGLGMWREELDDKGAATLMSSPSWAGTYPWIDRKTGVRGLIIAHVDTASENVKRDKFSGFWTSPVLANMVRSQLSGKWTKPSLPHHAEGVAIVHGAGLAWEAAGQGEPLILLHGHSFDRRMWDPQFAELAAKYRVIRYDLRGYGLSDMPVEGRDFNHADDLSGLMNALGIPKAHIVGLSLGGFVGLDFLALHPDRALTVTIASGGVYGGPGSSTFPLDEAGKARYLAGIEEIRKTGIAAHKSRWRDALLASAGSRAEKIRPLLAAMIHDWSAWQPLHIEPPLVLGRPALERIAREKPQVPALFLNGGTEPEVPDKGILEIKNAVPNLRVVYIPEAGHLSSMEQPEAFTGALLDFLRNPISPNDP